MTATIGGIITDENGCELGRGIRITTTTQLGNASQQKTFIFKTDAMSWSCASYFATIRREHRIAQLNNRNFFLSIQTFILSSETFHNLLLLSSYLIVIPSCHRLQRIQ